MPLLNVTHNTVFKVTPTQSFFLPATAKWSINAGLTFEYNHAFRVGQHCWIKLKYPIGTIGRTGYFYLPHVEASVNELRGVWLTNIDSNILHSRNQIEEGLQQLKQLGFNTIYPTVWQGGYTLYPSSVAEAFTGASIKPDANFSNRDMLAELIAVAKNCGLRILPWFEYGLAVPPNSQLHQRKARLISLDQRGEAIRIKSADGQPDDLVWLNPSHPEVVQFMVDLIEDVVTRYEVDGIQLDDHFGFPVELGYDAYTRDLYRLETGKPMPQIPQNPQRLKWTMAKMTQLLSQIFRAVKSKSDSLISISPNPLAFSINNYSVDWRAWQQEGLIEELVLQVYRTNLTSFINEVSKPEVIDAQNHIPAAIGVLAGIRTTSVGTSLIEQQLQEVRRRNFAGVSCFFYETVFNEQLSPLVVARNSADLQRLFVV